MRIIPAIDILDGKCVRLTKGNYDTQKTYRNNPIEAAKEFEANGLRYLHLVDLDGAKSQHMVNHRILRDITSKTSLQVDVGGGIKSDEDVRIAFENGAVQVTGGSIALLQSERFLQWLDTYGAEKIILGADCHDRKIATHGWLQSSETDAVDFILAYQKKGIRYTVCTDISKDGMLNGPALDLYQEILDKVRCYHDKLNTPSLHQEVPVPPPLHLIASGGIASLGNLHDLQQIGCEGAIIGKALYEGNIKLPQLLEFL